MICGTFNQRPPTNGTVLAYSFMVRALPPLLSAVDRQRRDPQPGLLRLATDAVIAADLYTCQLAQELQAQWPTLTEREKSLVRHSQPQAQEMEAGVGRVLPERARSLLVALDSARDTMPAPPPSRDTTPTSEPPAAAAGEGSL